MARYVANVDVTSDTFVNWVERTNQLLHSLSSEVITANSSLANTGNTASQRNAQLNGTFSANTITVETALRGGTFAAAANLGISTNTAITGTFTVSGDTTLNANVAITQNLTVTNSASFSNTLSVGGSTTIKTDLVVDVYANGDLGTGIVTPLTIYTFPKATYSSAKITAQVKNTGNTQISEMIVAHDGTTPYLTVYGTVASPPGAGTASPLGTFNVSINGANVEIKMLQTANNSSTKVVVHLIK